MTDILWEMPVAPSAITRGPFFLPLIQRRCELSFFIETEYGDRKSGLIFNGVEAFKCTYMTAMSAEMINISYGKLVCLGNTPWRSQVNNASSRYYSMAKESPRNLRHLMICFDGGPCYEIIGVDFDLI